MNYFRYIGGFNLKEAINLYLKESLEDSLTPLFTWFGREEDQRALYNARLTIAIYGTIYLISLHIIIGIILFGRPLMIMHILHFFRGNVQ